MKVEIRQIITDQINRHVAMSEEHREWLADDISTRVCAIVEPVITRLSDPHFDREGAKLDDEARLNWIQHMAAECEGRILSRLFLPDGKPLREKIDAAMQLNPA